MDNITYNLKPQVSQELNIKNFWMNIYDMRL